MVRRYRIAGLFVATTGLAFAGCVPPALKKIVTAPSPTATPSSPSASPRSTGVTQGLNNTYPDGVVTGKDGRTRVTLHGKTFFAPPGSSIEVTDNSFEVNGKVTSGERRIVVNGKVIYSTTGAGSGGGSTTETRTLEQRPAISGAQRLQVRTDYGSIKVLPATDDQITVTAELTLSGSRLSATQIKKWIAGFALVIDHKGATLAPRIVPPSDLPKDMSYTVSYQATVPSSIDLNLTSDNGTVSVADTHTTGTVSAVSSYGAVTVSHAGRDITAKSDNGMVAIACDPGTSKVEARSEYGAVRIAGTAKSIVAHSDNGAVIIDGANMANSVQAESEYGAVRLRDCTGHVNGTSENGRVEFSGSPTTLSLKSEYGMVSARVDDASTLAQADLKSENGAIEIELPGSASATFDAETENGSIELDHAPGSVSGEDSEKTYHQSINGGKVPVQLSTEYGRVTIRLR